MPKYDYECKSCEKVFEVTQKFHDDPLTKCLYCEGEVQKLISSSSFLLKGSGWYVTDYPSQSRKEGMAKDKSPSCQPSSAKSDSQACASCPNASN